MSEEFRIRVFTTSDTAWNEWIAAAPADVYFTSEYLQVYEKQYSDVIYNTLGGVGQLFVYANNQGSKEAFVAVPFLKRKIDNAHFDLASPYGYTGPLVKAEAGKKKELLAQFYKAFARYCKEHNIVSGFMRYSPILKNHKQDLDTGAEKVNDTVLIDLTKSEETLLAEMNKKARTAMRKAEKEGVTIEETSDTRELTRLYSLSMKKHDASRHYLFPYEFFETTKKVLGKECTIFLAKYQGKTIAAAICMQHKEANHQGNLHYHFSGVDKQYYHVYATNLLLWKAMVWGKEQGLQLFHLGGGTTGDPEDPLFKFKTGFSSNPLDRSSYYVKKLIFDQKKYDELSNKHEENLRKQGKKIKQGFFPRYRG
jgi:serine/alanine adding enzyme